ncbi:hypothetical protein Mapa_014080 [Marchantia paleacea]|nr:hypothetical protein Mapa_014080 [Marchantia paleacea]
MLWRCIKQVENFIFFKRKVVAVDCAQMELVGGNRLLRLCGMLSAQVLTFVVAYEIYSMFTSTHNGHHVDRLHSSNDIIYESNLEPGAFPLTLEKLLDPSNYAQDPATQMWFYDHVFDHPQAELRVLQSLKLDGAAPILSRIRPRDRDITLVTQTSADRLMAVERTAKTWTGEMVVAVHVMARNETENVYKKLSGLHRRIEALGRCRLNIYFAMEDGFESPEEAAKALYPVNAMRNIALQMVTTKLVFLLDADFVPNPGLHESLTEDEQTYQEILNRTIEQRQLLITPAFEADVSSSNNSQSPSLEIPTTKADLLRGWRNASIDCFHCARAPNCHMSTNFERYFDPATISPYAVKYRELFEPYFIAAKDFIPRFDGRFRLWQEQAITCVPLCCYGLSVEGFARGLRVRSTSSTFYSLESLYRNGNETEDANQRSLQPVQKGSGAEFVYFSFNSKKKMMSWKSFLLTNTSLRQFQHRIFCEKTKLGHYQSGTTLYKLIVLIAVNYHQSCSKAFRIQSRKNT